jgi:outer membrane receptor protein involved in Fe transport
VNPRGLRVLASFALLSAVCLAVTAQSTSGRLRGTVQDSEGAAMPGVTVTVTGETLPGAGHVAVTGDTGAYRFTALPPGSYDVTADMDGFQSQTQNGLRVGLGTTATADFVLYSTFSETVNIMSAAPLVDMTSSSSAATFTADFIEDLPTTRNFYDMMAVAPGVSLGTEDSSRVTAFGSNVQSNAWYTDGIEVTGPETGTSWVSLNPDMIQEIQVMGIGAPAEFGNMLGAALNVVTKSGTNELKGGANVYYVDQSLVDSQIGFEDSEFSEFEQSTFWDASATLGGPLRTDRAWYFLGYEYWRDAHSYPGSDSSVTPTQYQDRYDAKLSFSLNPKNSLDIKAGYNKWGYPAPASEFTSQSASAGEVGDDSVWGLNYSSVLNDRTLVEVRYAGWKSNDDNLSQTGSSEPAFIDFSPPGGGPAVYTGGVWYPWTYDTSTDQFSASVSHFADDFLHGDHDFKFGVQASKGEASTLLGVSASGTYYYHYSYDYYGYTYDYFVKGEQVPYFYGNEQEATSVFVDDSWAVNDRLTLNLGLRYDNQKGIIPSFPRLDLQGNSTGETIPGVNPVFTWEYVSPRVGFAYNVGEDRQAVVRGSFGVYYDGNVGGNWNSPAPFPPTLNAFLSSGGPDGPFDIDWFSFNAGANNVDPNLEAPKTLQYSLGFETALKENYSFGVMGVYKDTSHQIGWEFLDDGVYEEIQFTDPFNGQTYTLLDPIVFPTVRKGNGPGYTAAGYLGDYWSEYKGAVFTLNRRFTGRWGMQASYTYSESKGLNPRALSQWQNNPLYGSKEGSNPNQYFNIDGAVQSGDRPHLLRVQANWELPKAFRLNTSINLQSGRPYFREIRAPYGTNGSRQNYFVAEQFRHPFQNLVDVSVGRSFKLSDDTEIKLDLQFFNLLNNDATDFFDTVVLAEGETFRPNTWIKPRRLMLRIGVAF